MNETSIRLTTVSFRYNEKEGVLDTPEIGPLHIDPDTITQVRTINEAYSDGGPSRKMKLNLPVTSLRVRHSDTNIEQISVSEKADKVKALMEQAKKEQLLIEQSDNDKRIKSLSDKMDKLTGNAKSLSDVKLFIDLSLVTGMTIARDILDKSSILNIDSIALLDKKIVEEMVKLNNTKGLQ